MCRARAGERQRQRPEPARPRADEARAGKLIDIRAARPADAGAIAAIYAPHVARGTISFETEPPDATAIAGRMAAAGRVYPWLVAVEAGEPVGYAYAAAFSPREAYRWTVETTIYCADRVQRRGVGRRLYGALLADLTGRGFAQAIGRVALPNPASLVLHAALGFREAGVLAAVGWKHGRWIDVALWQRSLAAITGEPVEPGK